jgi:hypothetical protein
LPGPENFKKAIKWYQSYIDLSIGEPMCYQARLALGKLLFRAAKRLEKANPGGHDEQITLWLNQAKKTLCGATADDPMRVEHCCCWEKSRRRRVNFITHEVLRVRRFGNWPSSNELHVHRQRQLHIPSSAAVGERLFVVGADSGCADVGTKDRNSHAGLGSGPKPLKKSSKHVAQLKELVAAEENSQ